MVEDNNQCCICQREVRGSSGRVPHYYCAACLEEHKDQIMQKAPWVRYLSNSEKQRRKRRNRLLAAGYNLRPAYYVAGDAYGPA